MNFVILSNIFDEFPNGTFSCPVPPADGLPADGYPDVVFHDSEGLWTVQWPKETLDKVIQFRNLVNAIQKAPPAMVTEARIRTAAKRDGFEFDQLAEAVGLNKAEEPKPKAPKAEAPKAEAPKVEAPKVEAPKPSVLCINCTPSVPYKTLREVAWPFIQSMDVAHPGAVPYRAGYATLATAMIKQAVWPEILVVDPMGTPYWQELSDYLCAKYPMIISGK